MVGLLPNSKSEIFLASPNAQVVQSKSALKRVAANRRTTTWPARAVLFSSRHLSRKDARIDAEIDERVNDGSTDERGDDNYQHFQAEGAHTGSPPSKRELSVKSGENTPAAQRGGELMRLFGPRCPQGPAAAENASTAAPRAVVTPRR